MGDIGSMTKGRWLFALVACVVLTGPAHGQNAAPAAQPAQAEVKPLAVLEPRPDVRVEVTRLSRLPDHREIVELRFDVVNDSQDAVSLRELGITNLKNFVTQPYLLDIGEGRLYRVGGEEDKWSFSTGIPDGEISLRPGRRRSFWAWYKPSADAMRIGIMMPGIPPAFDVPIEIR